MKKCRKEKQKFLSRSLPMADYACAVWTGGFRTEIASNREAIVYGIKCICDYTPESIVLRYRGGTVSFCGRGLSCSSYVEGAVCIRGIISSVHYCE